MSDPDPLALVASVAFLPLLYVSIIVHELGHAVMGRAAGYLVTSFGLGTARPWCVVPLGRARGYLGLVRPFQGLTFAFSPRLESSTWRFVCYTSGGILANGGLFVVSVALWMWLPRGRGLWLVCATVNMLLGLGSLLPYRFRVGGATLQSDGALILRSLRGWSENSPQPLIIQSEAFLRPLWLSTGDLIGARIQRLCAAQAWTSLEDQERAEEALRDAQASAQPGPPFVDALRDLVRFGVEYTGRRLDAAAESLDSAEASYSARRDEVGVLVVRMNRAYLRIAQGSPEVAADDLDALVSHPLVVRHRWLSEPLLVGRVSARAAMSDVSAVEDLMATCTARSWSSACQELAVYRVVARLYAERGDWARAGAAFRRSLEAIRALADMWHDPEDRARFLGLHSGLFDEARRCFHELGGGAAAHLDPLAAWGPATGSGTVRNRRVRRAGVRVMLLNLVAIVFTAWLSLIVPLEFSPQFAVTALALALFTLGGLVFWLADLILTRLLNAPSSSRGDVILLLVCLPWPFAALALLWLIMPS